MKLREYIDLNFDGKPSKLAKAYDISPTQVSTWLRDCLVSIKCDLIVRMVSSEILTECGANQFAPHGVYYKVLARVEGGAYEVEQT